MTTALTIPRVTGQPSTRPLRQYPIIDRRLASLQRTDRLRQLGVADLGRHRADRLRQRLDRLYDRTPPPLPAAAAAVPGNRFTRMSLNSGHTVGNSRPGETRVLHRAAQPRVRPHTVAPAARIRRRHQHQPGECLVADPDGHRLWCRTCAADYLGLTSKTLANWAYEASPGPTVRGRKGLPRYRKSDLDRWSENRW
ncbi:MAG: hypothetical protein L0H74_01795 [Brachybacterium sp.]|nr:hypothetical protein [Brachybacterium sp.]